MNTLTTKFDGPILQSDLADVTKPIGKAWQVFYRALEANQATVTEVVYNGKTIPIETLVGNHR